MKASRLLHAFLLAHILFFILIGFNKVAFADHENPTVFVKRVVDECLYILKSEKNKDLQSEKILNLLKTSFDFPAITEALLKDLQVSDMDKLALTEIFPKLLQMRYGIFVKSPYSLKVEYEHYEFFYAGLEATVYTRAKVPGHDIGLNYKLHHRGEKNWKIYDIAVGDVSLVGNYRAQIQKVLSRSSFADFITHLEGMVGKKTSALRIQ